jgi:hypothetical protein
MFREGIMLGPPRNPPEAGAALPCLPGAPDEAAHDIFICVAKPFLKWYIGSSQESMPFSRSPSRSVGSLPRASRVKYKHEKKGPAKGGFP